MSLTVEREPVEVVRDPHWRACAVVYHPGWERVTYYIKHKDGSLTFVRTLHWNATKWRVSAADWRKVKHEA